MQILKNKQVIEDSWKTLSADDAIIDGDIIVPFSHWQKEKDTFGKHTGKLGVSISSDTNIDDVIANLNSFDLVSMNFPKYTDGTCFSYGFLLRERHKFEGELRATGDVFRDQFAYLERCGFDAIQLDDEQALDVGKKSFDDMSMVYQASADKAEPFYRVR